MPDLRSSCRLAVAGVLIVGCLGTVVPSALAAATPMVSLGDASTYAALSGTSVANTVSGAGLPHTTLRGDLGVKANTQPTGFPPGVYTGAKQVGNTAAAAAHDDLAAAYAEVAARTGGATRALALAGATIGPGLHTIPGAASNTTTVTLDAGGDPQAVFVFQVDGALAFAAGSHVVLAGGAQASRVFWQVNGAGAIGANADFAGTLMAAAAIDVGAGTAVNGRLLARGGALTLDANEVYSGPPAVAIDGEPSASTDDPTPTISGTTDAASVTVTFAGQILTATPAAGGAWSVTSAIRMDGDYPVLASVVDAVGNTASATQLLTIDTAPPVVTIADGASVTTNDPTPTIAGTSDAAVDTVIRVTVDAQSLRALVHAGGNWNIRPAALLDGTRTVTAAVTDPAGNEGTDDQELTIDTAAPAVTIAGGAIALTNDATPEISGTAAVAAGTTLTVTLADETLAAIVQDGGGWSATAAALSDGPHRVVIAVSDAAGNAAALSQTLTVDTVSPLVAIGGGDTATTRDLDPTIVGTSDAAPGTTVTVTIAGQTMTTLVQANGTWNATPTLVGVGAWPVAASAPDPAGNVGRATQTLTIAADEPAGPGATTDAPAGSDSGPGTASGTTTQTVTPAPPVAVTAIPAPAPAPARAISVVIGRVIKATVAGNASQRVRRYPLSIGTKVSASPGGRVVATASGTVKIKGVPNAIKLTAATASIAAGRSATLKLRPKGARKAFDRIRRAVRKGTKVTATITVKVVDAAGGARTVRRTVKLTK